jgi:WG containing repeat
MRHVIACVFLLLFTVASALGQQNSGALFVAPAGDATKCGYIDTSGHQVIPPMFDTAGPFSEGRAFVKKEGRTALIDASGRVITTTEVTGYVFSDGLSAINVNGNYSYINTEGKTVIGSRYIGLVPLPYNATSFSKGLAVTAEGRKLGYIDKNGKVVIPPSFDFANPFSEDLAVVGVFNPERWPVFGYIDKRGKLAIAPKFRAAHDFRDGLARVCVRTQSDACRQVFIDHAGTVRIKPNAEGVGDFSDGLAPVLIHGKVGFIDTLGKIVIEPRFDSPKFPVFSKGLAAVVGPNGKWGYIDRTGGFAIPPIYSFAFGFGDGLALVLTESDTGYIDRSGAFVWHSGTNLLSKLEGKGCF